jgi:zinc transport system substrate-binding protein
MFPRRSTSPLLAVVGASLVMAGCGADPAATADAGDDRLTVLAAFYPLQFAAERVGGDRVTVDNLTAPGAEPHDLELTPQDVGRVSDADLVVLLEGFQPAVDEAVAADGAAAAYDVRADARLDLATAGGHEDEHATDEHATDEHATDEHATDEHAAEGSSDPHFWLDPLRLADVSDALAARLGEIDAAGASQYEANAADLRTELEQLDSEMQAGLTGCTVTELVTSHDAFGYLAERYGFTQVGIRGLSPEDEPSAADLARLSDVVTEHGVTTVYSETLVSPELAETVAAETGASTAVLDPLEGIADDSAGEDYLAVMRANLEVLRAGQGCP